MFLIFNIFIQNKEAIVEQKDYLGKNAYLGKN